MYAVVEIQGSQFKVEKDQKLFVNRIDAKEGSKVSFDNVLLVDDGKKVHVGKPNLTGTSVEAKIVAHKKDDKVIVFKKKRVFIVLGARGPPGTPPFDTESKIIPSVLIFSAVRPRRCHL